MGDPLVRLSKFLSLVLRHQPQRIGLQLDAQGWAEVADLIAKANQAGWLLTPETLAQVVATNNKQRFAFSPDGRKIRASQGHSLPVELGLPPSWPPAYLFHGTARRFLPAIQKLGLVRGRRTHVHLSREAETARQVGQRHGPPVVLRINAQAMAEAGYEFWLAANGVWLTKQVPVAYIEFPAES